MNATAAPSRAQGSPEPLGERAPTADRDVARAVLRTEAAGLTRAGGFAGRRIRPRRGPAGRRHRPRRRVRHGQVRPCRPQDRRHPRLHRHAGPVRPSGRGVARRSRHDRARAMRCWRCPTPARRRSWPTWWRTPAASACRWWRSPARPGSTLARAARRGAAAAAGGRGLPDGPGADHQHHDADGAGRCAGGGAADAARLHGVRFPPVPSRRPAGRQAASVCAT